MYTFDREIQKAIQEEVDDFRRSYDPEPEDVPDDDFPLDEKHYDRHWADYMASIEDAMFRAAEESDFDLFDEYGPEALRHPLIGDMICGTVGKSQAAIRRRYEKLGQRYYSAKPGMAPLASAASAAWSKPRSRPDVAPLASVAPLVSEDHVMTVASLATGPTEAGDRLLHDEHNRVETKPCLYPGSPVAPHNGVVAPHCVPSVAFSPQALHQDGPSEPEDVPDCAD